MLANAMGAQFRRFENRDYNGKPARVVVATRTYDTDPDDLWDALTNRERLPRWFAPVDGDLQLGGRYQVKGNAGGTITRCDPPQAFDITWEFGGGVSWVTVRLEPDGDGTKMTLEHIAHEADVDTHWTTYGPSAVGVGWDLSFLGLGMHLDSDGAALDHAAVEAWSASDDGKVFMRASAEAWAAAHIAGGEDPAVARGMAERTAAFYTGG